MSTHKQTATDTATTTATTAKAGFGEVIRNGVRHLAGAPSMSDAEWQRQSREREARLAHQRELERRTGKSGRHDP